MTLARHKTKIVCTIGPASSATDTLEAMIRAGMNVARLNFSHGDAQSHEAVIRAVRQAAAAVGRRVAIMGDLPGPKLRIENFADEPITLEAGGRFILTTAPVEGDQKRVSVSFPGLTQVVQPGDILFLNDGLLQLRVQAVTGEEVHCEVAVGGELRSRKGLNLPGIDLKLPAFTEADRGWLEFAVRQGLDAVSQSFVEGPADIEAVRDAARALGGDLFVMAKIERSRALASADTILDVADGIMIARGDLGVEIPIERIAVVQKKLMRKALLRGKPVITATQMLESMTSNRRPTRAESTDVANAILDGTDCVMLSGESAMGAYPVQAVEMLAKIAAATEEHRTKLSATELLKGGDVERHASPDNLVAIGVDSVFRYISPSAVFVPSRTGRTARSVGRFKLPAWVIAASSNEATCQRLQFSYGVHPEYLEGGSPEDWSRFARAWLSDHDISGRWALLIEGPSEKKPDANHSIEFLDLECP